MSVHGHPGFTHNSFKYQPNVRHLADSKFMLPGNLEVPFEIDLLHSILSIQAVGWTTNLFMLLQRYAF